VLAPDAASGYSATSGLQGLSIPYDLRIVPQAGITLPILNSSLTQGNYGGIVTMSELSYDYGGAIGWTSAITADQWSQLYAYQLTFGVRMVRIDAYPQSQFGTSAGNGCCGSTVEQNITLVNITSNFPTANLKS
jgi:hypothetical protein